MVILRFCPKILVENFHQLDLGSFLSFFWGAPARATQQLVGPPAPPNAKGGSSQQLFFSPTGWLDPPAQVHSPEGAMGSVRAGGGAIGWQGG